MINQFTRSEVVNFPDFKPMYDRQYLKYSPSAAIIEGIKSMPNGTKVTIIMGTWCIDSKLQVPHFYKILDKAGISEGETTLICVDEHKKVADGSIDNLNIERVPTFIVYRNEAELGRIVESPKDTLEEDLLDILSSK
jgi:hypothetical protein